MNETTGTIRVRRFVPALATQALLSLLMFFGCTSAPQESQTAEQILSRMTTEEKVAQLFVISPDQLDPRGFSGTGATFAEFPHTTLTEELARTLKKYPVGGFCLFAKNIESKKQLKTLNRQLRKSCRIPPILAVDEEGGRVARLARTESLGLENVGSMESIGATEDENAAQKAGAYIGSYLAEYGFTLDFAPVADVNTNPENVVIGDRAFGSDSALVARMAGAFLSGLHSAGVGGCLKHFPGHGDTKSDTHADYVAVEKSWEELDSCELIPFKENLARADAVMVAHVTLLNATSDGLPASLSKELISGRLREELGYEGIVLTDALNMGAIQKNFGSGEAAVLAFEAGNDILLMPQYLDEAYKEVLAAVISGRISAERLDESVLRILRFKGF